jgi:hypothetical protein
LIRESPHYRREAFVRGLTRLGFRISDRPWYPAEPGDVLVVWNRHGQMHGHARQWEAAGLPVIVAENGYLGSDANGRHLFALARTHHNGAGEWFEGSEDRWAPLKIDLQPWRSVGRHILLLPQRGVGAPSVAMPRDWVEQVSRRLRRVTKRPIVVRPHPGKDRTPPGAELSTCWAAVTWASSAGLKALIAGVPVFHELPRWIGGPAARLGVEDIENPYLGDRLTMFRRLAHAQWTAAEIETGEPFARLLRL